MAKANPSAKKNSGTKKEARKASAKAQAFRKQQTQQPQDSLRSESITEGSFADLCSQLSQNRLGLIGFGLSIVQLLIHLSWMGIIASLTASSQSENLPEGAWQLWIVAGLMIVGGLLTAVSLFMCLYGAIHGRPKVLAILGLCLSFFFGALTTLILAVNAIG